MTARSCRGLFFQATFALPIDIFRVLVGMLSFVYFLNLMRETPDFSSPKGLIDHELGQEIFWYTRLSFFQPGMAAWHFSAIYFLAALAAWMIILGWRPKLAAVVLYVIAVSSYRWNFLVVYLDDGMMHLLLFWLVLLPIGRTLAFHEWLATGESIWKQWKHTFVPGATVYGFLANLALLYLTAGLWKWTSPMWRDGSALYAGLKMPISKIPELCRPEHFPFLEIVNYAALVTEPLLSLMVIFPRNHPVKWALVLSAVALHSGILLTLGIPYANCACLLGLVIVLRAEIMACFGLDEAGLKEGREQAYLDVPGKLSLSFVAVLTLAMIGDALPWWRFPAELSRKSASDGSILSPGQVFHLLRDKSTPSAFLWISFHGNPMYVPLWLIGIAQQYRLFDWIDDVNYSAKYEIFEDNSLSFIGGGAAYMLFPAPPRGVLLQAYLNDVRWGIIPPSKSNVLKQSLFLRLARRYCHVHKPKGPIEVFVTVERVTRENLLLNQGQRERFMAFECQGSDLTLTYMRLHAKENE